MYPTTRELEQCGLDKIELEKANSELVKALREASDNFVLIQMAPAKEHHNCADKYRAIADKYEL